MCGIAGAIDLTGIRDFYRHSSVNTTGFHATWLRRLSLAVGFRCVRSVPDRGFGLRR